MREAYVRNVGLAALLALAGCNQTAGWQRDGVSADDLQRDRVDCHRQADAQAEREAFGGARRAPVYEIDRSTGTVREVFKTERRSAALNERSRAQQYFESCMKTRGYRRE
ncbi:MAG: hypothetical protein RIM84_03525 [Alphaproteobacteria bacterium]